MSNPFNKLKVHRDEDEEEGFSTVGKTAAHVDPLFKKADDKAKKPKQRPKEEKKEETHQHEEESNEGFETVGKGQKKVREEGATEEGEKKQHGFKQGKEHKDKRHEGQFPANSKKRVFDRHSGTGRGKEVPKDGAGKGNWGNQAKSAKREVVDYDDTEYYFQKALNPKKEELVAPVIEEPVQAPVEEVKPEEIKEEKEEKEYKKKDKKGAEVVVDEKDKLIIPENAISYSEWKQQVKRTEVKHKEIKVEVNLEQIVKDKDETIQVAGKVHTEKKKKVKETNQKELEVNKIFAAAAGQEEKNKQTYNKKQNNQAKGFKFSDNEFPTLK